jgi:hypothetical protein
VYVPEIVRVYLPDFWFQYSKILRKSRKFETKGFAGNLMIDEEK